MAKVQSSAAGSRVSLRLETYSAGGTLPEGDYLFKENRIVLFDYDGKGPTTLAFQATCVPLVQGQPKGDEIVQHWSMGDADAFVPSEDGCGVVAIGNRTSLGRGSNWAIFLENLINAGFPEDKYDDDSSAIDGTQIRIQHIPAPKRTGLKSNVMGGESTGSDNRVIAVPATVLKLPWESKGKTAPAIAPKKGVAKATDSVAASTDGISAVVGVVLGENSDGMDKVQFRVAMFKAATKAKLSSSDRDTFLSDIKSDDVLTSAIEEHGFTLSDDKKRIVPV